LPLSVHSDFYVVIDDELLPDTEEVYDSSSTNAVLVSVFVLVYAGLDGFTYSGSGS